MIFSTLVRFDTRFVILKRIVLSPKEMKLLVVILELQVAIYIMDGRLITKRD